MPLTLTLSPQTGRTMREVCGERRGRGMPLLPAGRRWRQLDEGRTQTRILLEATAPALRLRSGRSQLQSIHWIDCFGCAEPLLTPRFRCGRRPSPYKARAPCG
ncbi:hypothetical protein EEQ99_10995 [Rhizobium anhuiense]|uniref:Uncharacterized protein n=1 Tax=Rhizobium anhuiense TaxID=1184720 RepID=A0A3S0QAA2_9HYPH|nr:hypothetical protein EEQ99_10995 [Rhizobium anhuiense]